MKNDLYPGKTTIALSINKLLKAQEKQVTAERMSSRMVECSFTLDEDEYVGWQMVVPPKGVVKLSVFGTKSFCKDNFEWILEETGKMSACSVSGELDSNLTGLYEIYLPIAESGGNASPIGFGNEIPEKNDDIFALWPYYFSTNFDDVLKALQYTGAVFRVVVGPATIEQQLACSKNTLRTYFGTGISPKEYIGHPVKIRVLLCLPDSPSIRLKTMIEESVHGAALRYLGQLKNKSVKAIWDAPLKDANVLPDLAARFLMIEPKLKESVVGIEVYEKGAKKIPATHKNTKDKDALTIGSAIDSAGVRRKIKISDIDLRRHYQIVGQTGTGKSTLLVSMILSAVKQGHGLTFFDPHGSTIDTVLRSIPEEYTNKVRVVRIGDPDNPVPMNIWDSDDPIKEERNINDLNELFADIFDPNQKGFVGPRWQRWFATFAKASIAFLGRRASLESIAVLSQSKDNMLKVAKSIIFQYPELYETIRQEYGMNNSSEFQEVLGWLLCKFQTLTAVEQLRETLGAGANALDFNHMIDTDTVTLIDLASPIIGTFASRIIGTLLMMKLWNAAMTRKHRDRTHLIFVDEASLFQTNPMPRMLAESRKFGISMVLCHQHTGQLTDEIRDALEANSANFSAFRLSPKDAVNAAFRFDNPELQLTLARLDAFNAITTISVDGRQSAPFTLEIDRPKEQKNGEEIAKKIEEHSLDVLVKPYKDVRALTAAEIQDLLDHPDKREKLGKPEVEVDMSKIRVGAAVIHKLYGKGTITKVEDQAVEAHLELDKSFAFPYAFEKGILRLAEEESGS